MAQPQTSQNYFGFLRLLLAITVMISHLFILSGNPSIAYLTKSDFGIDLGSIAVGGFFTISGFLLTGSILVSRKKQFVINRIFRIFPAYFFLLFITSIAILIFSATDCYPICRNEEFRITSSLSYFYKNIFLLQFQKNIDGLLISNPFPNVINGSLWSLAPEFFCYTTLFFLFLTFGSRLGSLRKLMHIFIIVVVAISLVIVLSEDLRSGLTSLLGNKLAESLRMLSALSSFFLGMSLRIGKNSYRQLLQKRALFLLSLLFCCSVYTSSYFFIGSIFFGMLIILLGNSDSQSSLSKIGTKQDFSYGIYLYHFPIIQFLVSYQNNLGNSIVFLALSTFALTFMFSIFSWFFIESPAKKYARKLGSR
jgi:peptidoglycan/LPS O-acetylase OafA/YrhL